MRIAVTGARGFVGRHVLNELLARGLEVTAATREVDIMGLPDADHVTWVCLDINQTSEGAFEQLGRPDVLIHLAWSGLPNYKSLHHFESELPIQYRFLSRLVQEGLPALLVTGTCFEYGMQSGPLSANAETRPINAYGLAKDTLRKQLCYLQTEHRFRLTWARLFYIYGEGQPPTSLLPMLEKAVAEGRQTFAMSGGEQLRDYMPVEDVAWRLVGLALDDSVAGTVNICTGRPISVRRLVEQWIQDRGWTISLDLGRLPYPDYEPFAFWGDPSDT